MKLVARAGKSPEPHPLEAVVCLQVREAHLNTLSFVSRFGKRLCLHLPPCDIAGVLMEVARDLARIGRGAALRSYRAHINGLLVMVFIAISASLAVFVIHRFASHALRRGPAWGCGFSDPTPAAQYSGGSFAQPIRRVFGTLVFHARDHVEMPAPGDIRPARLRIELHDLVWEGMYLPIAGAVGFSADRLNRLQFLTIRRYLSLVFATLVTLLLVLAIWS